MKSCRYRCFLIKLQPLQKLIPHVASVARHPSGSSAPPIAGLLVSRLTLTFPCLGCPLQMRVAGSDG